MTQLKSGFQFYLLKLNPIGKGLLKNFHSDRTKQHRRVLCNKSCRHPKETIKHFAVGIETFNTHDFKKSTEILMTALTPQLPDNCNKKESITSIINQRT